MPPQQRQRRRSPEPSAVSHSAPVSHSGADRSGGSSGSGLQCNTVRRRLLRYVASLGGHAGPVYAMLADENFL